MYPKILKDFERPLSELIDRISKIPSSIASDCLNRYRAMDASIKPLLEDWKICGPAFTVESIECCNCGSHLALSYAKKGDIIVISTRSPKFNAVWGYIQTLSALRDSIGGVVLDGYIRDREQIKNAGLPIFCKGASPGGPHKGWPCNINVIINCGGVVVRPGDIILGDDDGVVVIPKEDAEYVLKMSEKKIDIEQEWIKRVQNGEKTFDILGLSLGRIDNEQ